MGRHGPPKKPTALRLLHGDEERTINRQEPVPAAGTPEPPDTLSEAGRAVWDYLVPELDHMGLARRPDREQIAAYCEAVVTHAQALAILRAAGVIVRDRDKAVRVNPAMRVVTASQHSMLLWAREFGLTPASRVHLKAEQVGEGLSDLDQLLA